MQTISSFSLSKKIGLIAAPISFCCFLLLPETFFPNPEIQKVLAIAIWMLIWWITEAVSLSVTSLLPIILLPFTGIATIKEATASYSHPIVFLFLGGFMIALAMEKWQLHLRIALNIIKLTGTNTKGILFGLMTATAFLSMWISNTATTVMMLPIGLSIINLMGNDEKMSKKDVQHFSLCLLLGIAYAANVGGIATIIGTPPNSIFVGFIKDNYDVEISFAKWMSIGFPISVILLLLTYFCLTKILFPFSSQKNTVSANFIQLELQKLGTLSEGEKRVLWVFIGTAFLWITKSYISKLLPTFHISDAGISILAAVTLFIIPTDFNKGKFVLEWKDTEKLPWGILLLFGGGLALAGAMKSSGIINLIDNSITSIGTIDIFLITILLTVVMLFMTELMSNLALTTIFLPVVAGIALGLDADYLLMLVPVTIASSCAFMLPMATPPNAIVFASGQLRVSQMVKAGMLLNTLAIVILAIALKIFFPFILEL